MKKARFLFEVSFMALAVCLLSACAIFGPTDWNRIPPPYACQGLEEFGCPDSTFENAE